MSNNLSFKIHKTQTDKIEKQKENIIYSIKNFEEENLNITELFKINEQTTVEEIFSKLKILQKFAKDYDNE